MRLAIIGGGAAGFFASIQAKTLDPANEVVVLEASGKFLSKVRVSGGGRCNVTHACFDPVELITYYPRGGKELRQAFSRFMTGDTVDWFESRGVELKVEEDGRMFPLSDNSATIVDCLMDEAVRTGVLFQLHSPVEAISRNEAGFSIRIRDGISLNFDRVLIATGGLSAKSQFNWMKSLGHTLVEPVPSLFTFNLPGNSITALMGVSVSHAKVSLLPVGPETTGPVLITHWGLSGPAVLKLSSLAARTLHTGNYNFEVAVDWCNSSDAEQTTDWFLQCRKLHGNSRVKNSPLPDLPKRLWEFLVDAAGIPDSQNWSDLRKEQLEKLVRVVHHFQVKVSGKTTFKEEFVTCGGVALSEVDFKTMQSRKVPGLFFAGEVLDIDGLTGGFNFQAAWTTGFIAGTAMTVKN